MKNFEIGKITKAQGIRGELRVFPTTDDPSRFELLIEKEIFINAKPYILENSRENKNMLTLKLQGINDRNAAEALIGGIITIPAELALPLDTDEYYIRDLIGISAVTEDGGPIGTLTEVLHTGANDVYIITPPDGDPPFMLPAIKDVIQNISIPDKKITIRLTEGLKDLKA